MTILGVPWIADADAPKVRRRSLSMATVRKDMSCIGEEKAAELLEEYNCAVERVIHGYKLDLSLGLGRDDLRSIGRIAILEAYVRYEEDAKASLSTWVNRIVKWRVAEAVQIAFRGGREQLRGDEPRVLSDGHFFATTQPNFARDQAGSESHEDAMQKSTRSLQFQWLQVVLKRHFTAEERRLILGKAPVPTSKKAKARLKQRRYKVRERLMQLAVEAGVITRDRPKVGCHFVVKLTDDAPLAG